MNLSDDCDKIPYESRAEAHEDIDSFEVDDKHSYKPIRVYKCEKCNKYHLTSLDQEKKTKRNIKRKDKRNESRPFSTDYKITAKQRGMVSKAMKKLSKRKD